MNLYKCVKYIPRVFIKKGMPINLIYFVTSRCNASCRHCFYSEQLNSKGKELDLAEIEKVAKSIPDLLTLSLTGGEPFLRSDLAEIAMLFSKYTKVTNIQIPSNGLLTEEIYVTMEEILGKCRKDIRIAVGISIDDLGNKHDANRGVKGCFQRAIKTIKQLQYLEKKYSNFRVGCIITITNENQAIILDLIGYIEKELSVREVAVNIIRLAVKDMGLKQFDIKFYDNIMLKLRKNYLNQSYKVKAPWIERILSARQYYGAQLLSKIYSQNKYITACYAGSMLAIIKENGDVYPCEMLNEPMGELSDYDFNLKSLWYSEQSEKIRCGIKKQKCFCTYECAMSINTLFNWTHLFCILRDSLCNGGL